MRCIYFHLSSEINTPVPYGHGHRHALQPYHRHRLATAAFVWFCVVGGSGVIEPCLPRRKLFGSQRNHIFVAGSENGLDFEGVSQIEKYIHRRWILRLPPRKKHNDIVIASGRPPHMHNAHSYILDCALFFCLSSAAHSSQRSGKPQQTGTKKNEYLYNLDGVQFMVNLLNIGIFRSFVYFARASIVKISENVFVEPQVMEWRAKGWLNEGSSHPKCQHRTFCKRSKQASQRHEYACSGSENKKITAVHVNNKCRQNAYEIYKG